MRRFKSPEQAQRFLEAFGPIYEHFAPKRHRLGAAAYRRELAASHGVIVTVRHHGELFVHELIEKPGSTPSVTERVLPVELVIRESCGATLQRTSPP